MLVVGFRAHSLGFRSRGLEPLWAGGLKTRSFMFRNALTRRDGIQIMCTLVAGSTRRRLRNAAKSAAMGITGAKHG